MTIQWDAKRPAATAVGGMLESSRAKHVIPSAPATVATTPLRSMYWFEMLRTMMPSR
jgi:hypothetical protein